MSKIIGNTTATPNPQSDWNQTNATKADYIKNKPDFSMVIKNEQRITKLEQGYNDDFFITGGMDFAESWTVPENVLPYAEIKKIYGGTWFTDGNGDKQRRKPLRVESLKEDTLKVLDATLDTSEMVDSMTVKKLADGSFRFNGHTGSQDQRLRKFATVNLPEGTYVITYKVISNTNGAVFKLETCDGKSIGTSLPTHSDNLINGGTVDLAINLDGGTNNVAVAEDLIICFEIVKGHMVGINAVEYKFVPALIPIATLEIPKEVREIDGCGFSTQNYIDLERKVLVIARKIVDNTNVLLDKVEEIDISAYLSDDNFIEVAPNGLIRVIQDTGEIMSCKCEIVFMKKGI